MAEAITCTVAGTTWTVEDPIVIRQAISLEWRNAVRQYSFAHMQLKDCIAYLRKIKRQEIAEPVIHAIDQLETRIIPQFKEELMAWGLK